MIDKTKATKNGIKIIDTTKATNALFDILQTQFPQTIKDGKVSLNAIANLLGLQSSNMQGYELTFTGKGLANALYSTPCEKVLQLKDTFAPTKTLSQHEEHLGASNDSKNAIIIGDNLDALKILKSAYTEKIKMIYIDPPYNTANDNFIYSDTKYREDYDTILREVELIEIDENDNEIPSENLQFFKSILGSRTHSGWLYFMLPRLKLARDLLKEDGVIFISIDDNEQANLKILCDEIFGEDNFVANIIWQRTKTPARLSKNISKTHEFILVYAKDNNQFSMNKIPLNDEYVKKTYKNPDNDQRGKWRTAPLLGTESSSNKRATYTLPDGRQITGKWRCSEETLKRYIKENRLVYCENGAPNKKIFLSENEGQTINSILFESGTNDNATEELKSLFGIAIFDFPKPINLIKQFAKIATLPNNDDIVLDFFAGSGTTAQAVMELNVEDNGNRQCILVQLDEKIDSVKSKVAYDFCKNELKSDKPTISDITAERVRRASAKIATRLTKKNMDLGFKLYGLESKSKLISDEKGALRLMTNANLSANDKALNLALQSGKTLDKHIEIVVENKLYKCEDSYFCVECDEIVLEALSQTSDEYIYIDAYSDINLEHFLNLGARFKERLNVVY